MFSKEELSRYSRHISIPEFGMEGQQKLKNAKVLCVGAGGLGSPMLLYLAAAGVGTIGIVDFDKVDDSNLQRQVLYSTEDIGKSKAQVAEQKILALNPHIDVKIYEVALTSKNALDIISAYDVVADGTDNFPTRYLVNDACVLLNKVNVYASIYRFEGQLAVFNYLYTSGDRGPNYRDMFPAPPPPGLVPSCAEGGVLGVLPGILGCLQANEVIKVLTGIGEVLAGKIFLFDAAYFTTRTLTIHANPETNITGLIDYEEFCGVPKDKPSHLKEISPTDLKLLMDSAEDHQLIDVRETYEYDIADIGGVKIPLKDVAFSFDKIAQDRKVIVYCRSGRRSADAILELEQIYKFDNLYNLKGGILEWSDVVDSAVQKY